MRNSPAYTIYKCDGSSIKVSWSPHADTHRLMWQHPLKLTRSNKQGKMVGIRERESPPTQYACRSSDSRYWSYLQEQYPWTPLPQGWPKNRLNTYRTYPGVAATVMELISPLVNLPECKFPCATIQYIMLIPSYSHVYLWGSVGAVLGACCIERWPRTCITPDTVPLTRFTTENLCGYWSLMPDIRLVPKNQAKKQTKKVSRFRSLVQLWNCKGRIWLPQTQPHHHVDGGKWGRPRWQTGMKWPHSFNIKVSQLEIDLARNLRLVGPDYSTIRLKPNRCGTCIPLIQGWRIWCSAVPGWYWMWRGDLRREKW